MHGFFCDVARRIGQQTVASRFIAASHRLSRAAPVSRAFSPLDPVADGLTTSILHDLGTDGLTTSILHDLGTDGLTVSVRPDHNTDRLPISAPPDPSTDRLIASVPP